MYSGVLSPQRGFPFVLRIHVEDGGDRLAHRHPLAQPRANVVRSDAPFVQLVEASEVVDEVVEVQPARGGARGA